MNTKILLNNISDKVVKSLKEIYRLRKELSELEIEYKNISSELHKANNQLQRDNIEIQSRKKINIDLENDISLLKTEISNLKAVEISLREVLRSKDEEAAQQKNKLRELEKINSELETKNDYLMNEHVSGVKLINEYEIELQRLKDFFEQKKKIVTKKKTKEKI